MEPSFRVADGGDADTLLVMMRWLYEHERIAFNEASARAALTQLLSDDSCGVAHLILLGGEVAGCVSSSSMNR